MPFEMYPEEYMPGIKWNLDSTLRFTSIIISTLCIADTRKDEMPPAFGQFWNLFHGDWRDFEENIPCNCQLPDIPEQNRDEK